MAQPSLLPVRANQPICITIEMEGKFFVYRLSIQTTLGQAVNIADN